MANWKYKLKVGADRAAFDRREITLEELGQRFADKIRALPCFDDEIELDDMALEFENVSDVQDFDNILESLYDWADQSLDDGWPRAKMCWIEWPTVEQVGKPS